MTETKPSISPRDNVCSLLRARNTLLWVQTNEEQRAERLIVEAAAQASYPVTFWDCAAGFTDVSGQVLNNAAADPGNALRTIRDTQVRMVYVMRDLHKWFASPVTLRQLRSLARSLQQTERKIARAIVILSPNTDVPEDLSGHVTRVEFPLPTRDELASVLNQAIEGGGKSIETKPDEDQQTAIVDAAVGLTTEQASNCFSKSIVMYKRIDPALVMQEKKQTIAAEKVLTWHEPDPRGMDAVGGLDVLKEWLSQRRLAFGPAARAYGLPAPRGVLLVGVPGCGKSLTAKAVAAAWGQPLLRLDMGALRSKWVGESEGNIRKALQVAEAVSPCVVWLDEIEKALAGATQGAADGGVSADALGTILSWMQERAGSVFVVATANDVSALPPELLRKGRFDELFFVDLPTSDERQEILTAALNQYGVRATIKWTTKLDLATDKFTGAEVAAIVPDAMFTAFSDGERKVTEKDLIKAARTVSPLADTMAEKITTLRNWAKGRARYAQRTKSDNNGKAGRELDLE